MEAVEIVKYQVDSAQGMVSRVLTGLDDSALRFKACESAFSIGEIVDHLGEAYQAVITIADGGKHEWGSFNLKGATFDEKVSEVLGLREQAVAKVVVGDDEKLKLATDYIVGHDNYHVGQLVTARLSYAPDWNSYSIYGEE